MAVIAIYFETIFFDFLLKLFLSIKFIFILSNYMHTKTEKNCFNLYKKIFSIKIIIISIPINTTVNFRNQTLSEFLLN